MIVDKVVSVSYYFLGVVVFLLVVGGGDQKNYRFFGRRFREVGSGEEFRWMKDMIVAEALFDVRSVLLRLYCIYIL